MINEQQSVKKEADEVIRNINDLIEDFEFRSGCTLGFHTVLSTTPLKHHRIDKFDIIVM